MPESVRVFVSHHHSLAEDAFTTRLVADLESAGADVWVDTKGITSGNFYRKINDGLSGRDWLVLVMTPDALKSEWVQEEVFTALYMVKIKGMRGVIPIVMTACNDGDIPPMWLTLHRYDATHDYVSACNGLLDALSLPPLVSEAPKSPQVQQVQVPSPVTSQPLPVEHAPLTPPTLEPPTPAVPSRAPDSGKHAGWLNVEILEDTDMVYKSLEIRIQRAAKIVGTTVHVHHRRSQAAFAEKLNELLLTDTPTMLVFCDIEHQQGQSEQKLREYMKQIWQQPADTWVGRCPIIVYTRNDDTYGNMRRLARHSPRALSAVILQTPTVGSNPREELRDAITAALLAA